MARHHCSNDCVYHYPDKIGTEQKSCPKHKPIKKEIVFNKVISNKEDGSKEEYWTLEIIIQCKYCGSEYFYEQKIEDQEFGR